MATKTAPKKEKAPSLEDLAANLSAAVDRAMQHGSLPNHVLDANEALKAALSE